MNWENPPPGFQYILFERIEPATASSDVARSYYLAFVPRRWRGFGGGGVRGRKGRSQQAAYRVEGA